MNDEKIILIDVNLTRGLAVVLVVGLLTIALLGYLAFGHEEAAASNPKTISQGSAGMRQYYLTQYPYIYDGATADTACANGYHFASLWEILDPSNLKYNTDLGSTRDDSGQGPPTGRPGWVRTGYESSTEEIPGKSNCNNWDSYSIWDVGTTVMLPSDWTTGGTLNTWVSYGIFVCGTENFVWCVED